MKVHSLFLGICFASVTLVSCGSEEELFVEQPQNGEAEYPSFVTTATFPEDDGSATLAGTSAQAVLNLLTKAGPDVARELGSFNITDEQYAEIKAFTDELVADCKTELKVYNTIFKWVVGNIRYEFGNNDPYAVFKQGYAICQGYANLMNVMLHSQGIPVLNVNGMLVSVGGHAWNYAYVDKKWLVVDATNNGSFSMLNPSSYSHLDPMSLDADLFEDEQFVFNFSERRLNLRRVKSSEEALVVPFSAGGFRVTSFNPDSVLPRTIREVYIGKNIVSLGENILGLKEYGSTIEAVYVDENNKSLVGYCGSVYYKKRDGLALCYIPSAATKVELAPIEVMEKNYITYHNKMEEVIIAPGTKKIEAYAFEACPKLRKAYIPEDTEVATGAFYKVHPSFEIIRGDYTGIPEIKM